VIRFSLSAALIQLCATSDVPHNWPGVISDTSEDILAVKCIRIVFFQIRHGNKFSSALDLRIMGAAAWRVQIGLQLNGQPRLLGLYIFYSPKTAANTKATKEKKQSMCK